MSIDIRSPLTGDKITFLHWFSDASLNIPSVSGGVGMLACVAVYAGSRREHLSAPDSHTGEVVAADTNFNQLVPVASVQLGASVPFYL